MNVATLLERAAERRPDAWAVIDAPSGARWTAAAFVERVFRFGANVRASLDEPAGARVAILADPGFDYLCADYGAMSAGLVRMPMDPHLSVDEAVGQLRDAEARIVLCDESHRAFAEACAAQLARPMIVRDFGGLDAAGAAAPVRCPPDALASLNYTGGSTGAPKAVMHSHGSLSAALQNIVMARPIEPGCVFLNVRPLWPIAAIVVLAHLVAGGTVVLGGSFAPPRFWSLLEEFAVELTSLVPTQLVRLLRDVPQARPACAQLRAIDVGAAAVPIDVLQEALAVFGPRLSMLYGLTEAPWTCYRPAEDVQAIDPERPETHGYVGRALFGVELEIREGEQPLAAGAVGEVCVRGAHVMGGYWRQPERTAAVLRDGWFHTGDLGRVDDGRLFLAGRVKNVIRSGGQSVLPDEVEDVLVGHPAVAEAAVVGLPDREWGEIVVAAVVLHAIEPAVSVEALSAYCRERLSRFKCPKALRIVAQLPRSHYGKVQAAKVRELFASHEAAR